MDWLPLTLVCAFTLASADAATKRYLADYTALELTVIRFVFTGLLLAPLLFIQPLPSLPWAFHSSNDPSMKETSGWPRYSRIQTSIDPNWAS